MLTNIKKSNCHITADEKTNIPSYLAPVSSLSNLTGCFDLQLQIKDREVDFLVLEDLTKDFKEPCIMDIKIGRRTWDPNASYDKIIAEDVSLREVSERWF